MINKIRSFFSKESEDENLLAIGQKDWISEYKKLFENLPDDSQSRLIDKINEKAFELKEDAIHLANAEFKPYDIDKRLIEMIEDNRISYVKQLKTLCDSIIIEGNDILNLKNCLDGFSRKMSEFGSVTSKIYFTLKDPFYPHMSTVAENIKAINSLYRELNDSVIKGVGKEFEDIKNRTHEYFLDVMLEKNLKEDVEALQNEVEEAKSSIATLEKRKESLKASSGFNHIREEYNKREDIITGIDKLKNDINDFMTNFTELLSSLKSRLSNQVLAESYVQNPLSALIADESFEILKILEETKTLLKNKECGIEYRKRQKFVALIDKTLKKPMFGEWINEYKKLQKELKESDNLISRTPSMLNLSEIDYKISHAKDKIEKKSSLISLNLKKLESMDLKSRKASIEADLINLTGKRIMIV